MKLCFVFRMAGEAILIYSRGYPEIYAFSQFPSSSPTPVKFMKTVLNKKCVSQSALQLLLGLNI
jgi:hypothetical protein